MVKQHRLLPKQSAHYATRRLPREFIERIDQIVPKAYRKKVLESFCRRHPTTFRANTTKIDALDLLHKLKALGFNLQRVPWYKDAFILLGNLKERLAKTDTYKNGELYVQSLSSMIPPLILAPKPGEKVLDICSAPGSKTTQMAALMENTGELVANDINQIRVYKLEANLKQQGVTNVIMTKLPAEAIWKKAPEQFDKTLVDVPCSMEGMFYCGEPKTFEGWSLKKVHYLAKHQKWILRSAVSATKPGGTIVYSTCTLAPEENEGVIDWILTKEKGSLELEEITLAPNIPIQQGLTSWQGSAFDPSVTKTVRILQSPIMEGFFIAKLRKKQSTIPTFVGE